MENFDYKKNILKRICQTNQIEYKEEKMEIWTRYNIVESELDYQRLRVYMPPKEKFEAHLVEQLFGPMVRGGISINEKEFFEEYVVKMVYRYCEDVEKYGDEIIVFVKEDLLELGVGSEEWDKIADLSNITNFFDIHYEVDEYKKYEYSSLANSVYKTKYGNDESIEINEYENGMLFFDSKTEKYFLWYEEIFCPLDANYISFVKGDEEFNPVVNIRYFIKIYFSMLKKKTEKEHVFAVEDTEDNVKKIKRLIERIDNPFAVCDYKENHYYIKCLSGEDDELLFRLQL